MIHLAPSILSADFAKLGEILTALNDLPISYIHIDVMDGHFVPNLTIGPPVIKCLRAYSNKFFDVHLMITNPENYIQQYADAGANIITIHYEATSNVIYTLQLIKKLGVLCGLAINPHTPVEAIFDLLPYLDIVLVMSVNPGFGGQSFLPTTINKITKLKNEIIKQKTPTKIEVDGGINEHNIINVIKAQTDIIVVGYAIFGKNNYLDSIRNLLSIIHREERAGSIIV